MVVINFFILNWKFCEEDLPSNKYLKRDIYYKSGYNKEGNILAYESKLLS